MENLTKYQAAEIALMLSDHCNDQEKCDDCIFCTRKGCMISDVHDQVIPSDWKVRQIDLFI